MGRKKKPSAAKKAAAAAASRGVVGPDYVQVLAGTLASKSITLVLCGESHHDAVDVTRAGGGKVKEGWIPTDYLELAAEMVGKFGGVGEGEDVRFRCGMCKRNAKAVALGKAREWGRDVGEREIEYIDHGHQMALLWVPTDGSGRRGRAYLVELFLDEAADGEGSRAHLPSDVVALLDNMTNATKQMRGAKSLSRAVRDMKDGTMPGFTDGQLPHTLLSWDDLDAEARLLNHRRLLGEEISTSEYDELIRNRKQRRRTEENIWTWDDWLVEVKSKLSGGNSSGSEGKAALHVVLESAIPPSEVELCRDAIPGFECTVAADCIRCLSEDSDPSEADLFDPAADGFGSYMDYIYRRLLGVERAAITGDKFLHSVDCRDLGCEHSCVEGAQHKEWMELLHPEEKGRLLGSGTEAAHAHHKDGRCLPDWSNSVEEEELDRLQSSGLLKNADDINDGVSDKGDASSELITFPSMESFFGQCTDILYYTPSFKVSYAPFLGKCVGSFDNWNAFFSELFFGGTVERALSLLDLDRNNRPYLHIRSPIMKFWNAQTGEYEWHKRANEEADLTLSMLPVKAFLKAKGSNPSRTWSSNMFASLLRGDCKDMQELATNARQWVLDDIAKHCDNPKLSDDELCGGEWFLGYLRQCHREIYDDIDCSDPSVLLRKQYAVGDTKRHKIGDITIPDCIDGFQLIAEELSCLDDGSGSKPILSKKAEVMAKILVDIYMSKLVDAATVIKIGSIIAHETDPSITIVCYLGSVHSRAVCDFFTQKYGFKKKIFCGKQTWDDDDGGRIIHFPMELWDNSLFNGA